MGSYGRARRIAAALRLGFSGVASAFSPDGATVDWVNAFGE